MTDASTTRFDFIFDPSLRGRSRVEDTLLAETESFAVIPSLGSLVPGWLLVVPKRRVLNCGRLADRERSELKELTGRLTEALRRFPGRVFAFEHGSTDFGSLTGCGVDQAHMHLVPLEFDLLAAASHAVGVTWDTHSCDDIVDLIHRRDAEYVAIHDRERGCSLVGKPITQVSQWVRKIIAAKLERSHEWDYRQAAQRDVIGMTIEALGRPPGIRA